MGSDPIHAVGEGRLGCEASGPPRGATWVTQTQTRFFSAYSGMYVVVLYGYWLFFFRFPLARRFCEELRFAIRYCVSWRCDILYLFFSLPLASTLTVLLVLFLCLSVPYLG